LKQKDKEKTMAKNTVFCMVTSEQLVFDSIWESYWFRAMSFSFKKSAHYWSYAKKSFLWRNCISWSSLFWGEASVFMKL